jgi:hypothetical protein
MLATGDNFAIFFNGNALPRQIQRFDQLSKGKRRGESSGFAVDGQFNHKSLLFYPTDMSFSIIPNSTPKLPEGHEDRRTLINGYTHPLRHKYPKGHRHRAGVV